MCDTSMNQTCADFENMCADMADDLFRLHYCVVRILELSAITTDTQERAMEFARSQPEIYSCADIACDYSSRLQSALGSMRERLEAIGKQDGQQALDDINK